MEFVDGRRCRFLDRVGDRDHTCKPPIHTQEHGRCPAFPQLVADRHELSDIHFLLFHQREVAKRDAAPVDDPHDALTGHRLEPLGLLDLDVVIASTGHDGHGDGVFAA